MGRRSHCQLRCLRLRHNNHTGNSTISGNTAGRNGGGIYSLYLSDMTVEDSTISGILQELTAAESIATITGDVDNRRFHHQREYRRRLRRRN